MAFNNNSTAIPTTPYDGPTFHVTMYLTTISAGLSILGSVFIFVTYCLWEDVRSNSRRILVFITLADFLAAICHMSGVWYIPELPACIAQAFVDIFAVMSSTFWTVAMAIYLYVSAARSQAQLAQKMMIWFHLICWFVPLTMACLAFGFKALGRSHFLGAAGWCWIQTDRHFTSAEEVQWMFWSDFFWKITASGIIIVLYTLLRRKLRQALAVYPNRRDLLENRAFDAAAAAEKKLIFVPLLYIVLYIWGLGRFILFIISPDTIYKPYMEWLTAMNGVGSTLQGFTNFLFYCFLTKRFMDPVRKCFRCCSCWSRKLQITGEDLTYVTSTQNTSTVELNHGEQEPFLKVRKHANYQTSAGADK